MFVAPSNPVESAPSLALCVLDPTQQSVHKKCALSLNRGTLRHTQCSAAALTATHTSTDMMENSKDLNPDRDLLQILSQVAGCSFEALCFFLVLVNRLLTRLYV